MIKTTIFLVLVCFFCLNLSGQQISNIRASQLNDFTIRVSYDLQEEVPGQLFNVSLFCSVNQFTLPMEYVEGYVGDNVQAGTNNYIDWDVRNELVAFDGELSFEVRAELTFTPISLVFPERAGIKRGKQQIITWEGTNTNERVDIQLLRDGREIGTIANTINDGQYEWDVPYSTKPGNGYTVKVSSTSSSQTDTGDEFAIRRKIPLLVKVLPFVIVTPVVIELLQEDPVPPRPLPPPPNVPN